MVFNKMATYQEEAVQKVQEAVISAKYSPTKVLIKMSQCIRK